MRGMHRVEVHLFFFSSRRRHTRLQGDWSSDVCSSDLPTGWPGGGLNQLVYVRGGRHSALWTEPSREFLRAAPDLTVSQAQLVSARRERLPGIGVQLVVQRKVEGAGDVTSVVTLYDELPWLDVENRITKPATLEKEALYVAFPFALTRPTVEVEVPLGRMTVDRDQQRG